MTNDRVDDDVKRRTWSFEKIVSMSYELYIVRTVVGRLLLLLQGVAVVAVLPFAARCGNRERSLWWSISFLVLYGMFNWLLTRLKLALEAYDMKMARVSARERQISTIASYAAFCVWPTITVGAAIAWVRLMRG